MPPRVGVLCRARRRPEDRKLPSMPASDSAPIPWDAATKACGRGRSCRSASQPNRDSEPRNSSPSLHPDMNARTVKRKPRLPHLSRSGLSTASSTTIADSANDKTSKPLPPPPSALLLSFYQLSFNEMVAFSGSSAQYHITVFMNCFIPSSYITVIRREHAKGEFVSSFEMGISTQRATVNMHGNEKFLDAVLTRTGKRADVSHCTHTHGRIWQWKWDDEPGHCIGWHGESPYRFSLAQCYHLDSEGCPTAGGSIAGFAVCPGVGRDGTPRPPKLKIEAEGLHIIDHVFTSALIVERKRLTPSGTPMAINSIFN
ncbi:hypothetical protein C8Q79DRAFT_308048 [Trametes meyenii]|nr:hypothetical protein C8Q79DRAFT_308048 [Trametes meyenii]